MTLPRYQTWPLGGRHGNFQINSFCNLCRFLPRQMLACLRAVAHVCAKAGLFFEVLI